MSVIGYIKRNKLKSASGVIFILLLLFVIMAVNFRIAPVTWKIFSNVNSTDNIAIQSADSVAYFTQKKYVKGLAKYSVKYKDTTWHFSSIQNKDLFKQNPEKYIPQYGGYCSVAVKEGLTATVDPSQWLIENNKLYLFFDASVKNDWMSDTTNTFSQTADKNWASRFM